MTSRENYSLRGNASCAFSSAHSPDKVANKKHTLLFEKQKVQGMRGGRVGSSEVMKATKSGKLMAQQTPLQSAFLGRKLRKCCHPHHVLHPRAVHEPDRALLFTPRGPQGWCFGLQPSTSLSSASPLQFLSLQTRRKSQGSCQSTEQWF